MRNFSHFFFTYVFFPGIPFLLWHQLYPCWTFDVCSTCPWGTGLAFLFFYLFLSTVFITSTDLSSSWLFPFVNSILWLSSSGEFLFRIFYFSGLEFPSGSFCKFYFSAISYIFIHYEYTFLCIIEHSYNSYFKDFKC